MTVKLIYQLGCFQLQTSEKTTKIGLSNLGIYISLSAKPFEVGCSSLSRSVVQ